MAQYIPTSLKVLPLPSNQVLFPGLVISVSLHQRSSIALLKAVIRDVENGQPGQPAIIGVAPLRVHGDPKDRGLRIVDADDEAASKSLQVIKLPRENTGDDDNRRPTVDDINEWACAARILRIERLSADAGYVVVVEGLSRIRIDRFIQVGRPYFEAQITAFGEAGLPSTSQDKLVELKRVGSILFDTFKEMQLSLPSAIVRRLRTFLGQATLQSAGSLADALVSTLAPSHADKLALLAVTNAEERVSLAIEILSKANEELGTTKRIGERVNDNMTRRQRQFFLQQQMEAIAQELRDIDAKANGGKPSGSSGFGGLLGGSDQEEADELAQLEKQIEAAAMPAEAYQAASRELKRLKRIPPQSMEHNIIRNYLDWMVALPWGRSSASTELDRAFLDRARKQLDDDHYGLEKVKKRLLEHLAVLRLRADLEKARRLKDEANREDVNVLRDTLSGKDPEVHTLKTEPLRDEQDSDAAAYAVTDVPVPVEQPIGPPAKRPGDKDEVPHAARQKGPILLLQGPPGVGKTSIARSLATAMGRKFHRISLGGVRDEAEIRGHRRTYVGAMPGLVAQALRKVGTNDAVILLDEIDKIAGGAGFHGDPAAAMLEVLDPEQNWNFNDHYINTGIDLSQILFIATANTLETISPPLMDRMEVIQLSGYVFDEKATIARKYLLPKQLEANALDKQHIDIEDDALMQIITHWTHEPGVRTLERQIGAVCRAKAVEYAEARDAVLDGTPRLPATDEDASTPRPGDLPMLPSGYTSRVAIEDLERLLGPATNEPDPRDLQTRPGVAAGLAYRGSGNGGLLYIEATSFPSAGSGKLKTTGSLGDVIAESAQLALTWVRAHAYDLALTDTYEEDVLQGKEIHLHLPSGAVKKDGPSAGVAMTVCLVSLLSGLCVRDRVAMTGEVTLRGLVTPVGGIKEKVLAAHRMGIRTVILPQRNEKDVKADLPDSVKQDMSFVFVSTIWDALSAAFGPDLARPSKAIPAIEARRADERMRRRKAETVQSRL